MRITYILYLIMLYIDMLSITLHDSCIHHYNGCAIDIHSCTLLYYSYMQYHYIAFLLILLEYYTSSYIFRVYILH